MAFVTEWTAAAALGKWMKDGKEICVHFLDGRKEWHGVIKETAKEALAKIKEAK